MLLLPDCPRVAVQFAGVEGLDVEFLERQGVELFGRDAQGFESAGDDRDPLVELAALLFKISFGRCWSFFLGKDAECRIDCTAACDCA